LFKGRKNRGQTFGVVFESVDGIEVRTFVVRDVGGMMTKPSHVPAPGWVYYFNVDDIDAATIRVKDSGGQTLFPPMQVPGGSWIVQCRDPQGAMFAMVAAKK